MAIENVDFAPVAADAETERDEVFDACAHCGEAFETGVRYPVTTRREFDGSLTVLSFCDDACQRAWADGE